MRDKRFVAKHRGGPLSIEHHRQMMHWAIECSEHVLHLIEQTPGWAQMALYIARTWETGGFETGICMKTSARCHKIASESENQLITAIARSIGHAVATAHMADHSIGAAMYALKAVSLTNGDVEKEREWQNSILPEEIKDIILENRTEKEKHFKLC